MTPVQLTSTNGPATVPIAAATPSPTSTTATPSLLPDPATALISSGDMGAQIAALAVQTGETERTEGHQERQTEELRAEQELDKEVQAIHEQASLTLVQGWTDATLAVATGVAGAASGTPAVGSGGAGGTASGVTSGSVIAASKSLVDASFGAGQKNLQANQTAAAGAVANANAAAQDAHDTISDASDGIKAALSFYQEYEQARGQTSLIAAQRG
jgi:hypothetical protein